MTLVQLNIEQISPSQFKKTRHTKSESTQVVLIMMENNQI